MEKQNGLPSPGFHSPGTQANANTSPLLSKASSSDLQSKSKSSHTLYKDKKCQKFKMKCIQTLTLFFAFGAMGLSGAIVGPTLMDIERLTNTNTETVAWIMTSRCLGGILGVIIMGVIFTRGNPWLLMGVANLVAGAMLMVTPLFRNIVIMCVFYVIHGAGRWFVDGGCNIMILAVWGLENGPWMQGLHCSAGIGSLLAPVIASPFLSPKHKTYDEEEIFSNGTMKVYFNNEQQQNNNFSHFTTPIKDENVTLDLLTESRSGDSGVSGIKIFIAFFIVSMHVILSAIAFLTLFLLRNKVKGIKRTSLHVAEEEEDMNEKEKPDSPKKNKNGGEPKKAKCLDSCNLGIFDLSPERFYHIRMLTLVALFDIIQCLVTINYGNFVFTFAVKYLNWRKSQAVMVTSAYWGAFTCARILAIFLSKFLHPRNLLLLCLITGLGASGVLLFFAKYHVVVLWICTIFYGFAMAPLFATSVSLLGRYISVSGPEGATLVMSTIIGEMTGPVLVGLLFNRYGPISLVYVMVVVQCTLLIVFVIIYFSGRNKVRSSSSRDLDIIEEKVSMQASV